jgi:O-antigen/teichoic acid export membrane protein
MLVRALGTDRFGILTLAWALIGYFSLFDFGLGRALTKVVAERTGQGRDDEVPGVVWTATWMMAALGIVAAGMMAVCCPWLVRDVLKVPRNLQQETLHALLVLAGAIPIVTTYTGLRGVLEAWLRFDLTSAVRIPMGVLTFVGPLAVLPFSHSVFSVVAVLAAARALGCVLQLLLCIRTVPGLRGTWRPQMSAVPPLLRFGSWMTVSNVISPLMVSVDRFVIGAIISVTAVAYYATPYEAVTKLLLIPAALVGVLFPAFSRSSAEGGAHTSQLFRRGVKVLVLALFPLCLLTVVFSREALTIWLGSDFSAQSGLVLQLLAIGVFVNGLASVPFALVQGIGRPDVTAKLHLLEFPIYLLLLWWLVVGYGIVGAAIAWVLRMAVDAALLFVVSERTFEDRGPTDRPLIAGLTTSLALLAMVTEHLSVLSKAVATTLALLVFVWIAWSRVLAGEDRVLFTSGLQMLGLRGK